MSHPLLNRHYCDKLDALVDFPMEGQDLSKFLLLKEGPPSFISLPVLTHITSSTVQAQP